MTSLAILGMGVLVFAARNPVRGAFAHWPATLNGVRAYDAIVDATYRLAYRTTTLIQGGPMAPQISVTLLAAVAVMVYALTQFELGRFLVLNTVQMPTVAEFLIFAVAMVAAGATVRARSRLSAIISLGIVGIAVTLFFVFYSAPDLALTQLLIEVLTVILLVLVFFRVKPDAANRTRRARCLPFGVAVALGFFGAGVVLVDYFCAGGPEHQPLFPGQFAPARPGRQRGQCHPGRHPRLRHAGRDHGAWALPP